MVTKVDVAIPSIHVSASRQGHDAGATGHPTAFAASAAVPSTTSPHATALWTPPTCARSVPDKASCFAPTLSVGGVRATRATVFASRQSPAPTSPVGVQQQGEQGAEDGAQAGEDDRAHAETVGR